MKCVLDQVSMANHFRNQIEFFLFYAHIVLHQINKCGGTITLAKAVSSSGRSADYKTFRKITQTIFTTQFLD